MAKKKSKKQVSVKSRKKSTSKKAVKKVVAKKVKKVTQKKAVGVTVPVDSDGYLSIDLNKSKVKGIKLTFTRKEGRTKRRVALKIDA